MADDVNRGTGFAGIGGGDERPGGVGFGEDEPVVRPPMPSDPWAGLKPAAPAVATPTTLARVELIGNGLRAEGMVSLGRFARVTDYVNLLSGYFTIEEVTLLTRLGERTRVRFPDLRVRLADIAIVGRRELEPPPDAGDHYIPKQRRRLVVMTSSHIVYGYAHLHLQASMAAFIDSNDPPFLPMTDVRVRWLSDRRLAGRFPLALVQRNHIIGVATHVSGATHGPATEGSMADEAGPGGSQDGGRAEEPGFFNRPLR